MARARGSEFRKYEPLLLFLGLTLLLFLGKALLIPLAFALTLCFLVLPVSRRLEQRLPRPAAVGIIGAVTSLVLVLGAYTLSRQVLQLAETLPGYRENMKQRMTALHSSAEDSIERALSTLSDVSGALPAAAASPEPGQPVPVRLVTKASPARFAYTVAGAVLRPVADIGIVIIFAMYMLMRREELRHRILMLAGTAQLGRTTRAMDEAAQRISRYLVTQLEVNACYGLLFGTGLYFIGVPNAILWGVIAGTLRIVPYLGTAVGMVLPLVAAIAVSASWWAPALVLGWFLTLELACAYLLEPRIFSSRTGISSLALLVSAIFWTMLWGWPGLALATPMTVCAVVLAQYVPQLSFLHSLLGRDAQLSPTAHFYERLLATDHTEAYAIAERFLQTRPLVELYDSVLIPTLSLAKEDRHRGTLDEARFKFLLLSVGELIALLADLPSRKPSLPGDAKPPSPEGLFPRPRAGAMAIVCISAPEAADQLTTQMLAQVLEGARFQNLTISTEALTNEILAALAQERDTVVVISALPPFAFAQARGLCHRVRHYMAENRIAVALWGNSDDHDDTTTRFGAGRPNAVVGTLGQLLTHVIAWESSA